MFNKKHLILLTTIFISMVCYSQTTGTIRGHLKDEYGKIIKSGMVKIKDTNLQANADSNGYYQIIGVEPGNKKLIFWAVSYKTKESEVLVVPGFVIYVDANNFVEADLSQMHYIYEVTQVPYRTNSRIDFDMDFYKQTGIMKRLKIKSIVDCPTLENKPNYKLKYSSGGM